MKPVIFHMRACNFFGGPERQILSHIKYSWKFRHVVLTFIENRQPNELEQKCRAEAIPVETIETGSSFEPSAVLKLRRLFQTERPSILCSHGYKPTILSLLAKPGLNIPLIVFSRGHTGEDRKVRFFETLERKSYRFADAVVAVSNGYAQYLKQKGVNPSRVSVIQNAVEVSRFSCNASDSERTRKQLGFKRDDFLIATAGRLSPEKGQADLIDAFSKIQPDFGSIHLLLLGDGPLAEELKTMVQDRKLGNVHFLGFRRDIDEIMCAIDLFVLPSHTEGLPNVILEAFSCRKPVVATCVGGVPEVVDDCKNGFLVEPQSPDALADAMKKCLSDRHVVKAMGEEGYHKVSTSFSVEAQTQKLEAIYNQILNPAMA